MCDHISNMKICSKYVRNIICQISFILYISKLTYGCKFEKDLLNSQLLFISYTCYVYSDGDGAFSSMSSSMSINCTNYYIAHNCFLYAIFLKAIFGNTIGHIINQGNGSMTKTMDL